MFDLLVLALTLGLVYLIVLGFSHLVVGIKRRIRRGRR